jgi:hypothetical protein
MPHFAARAAAAAFIALLPLAQAAQAGPQVGPQVGPQGGDDPQCQVAAAAARPAAADGIDVEVVDRDGKPVADAVVGVIDFDPRRCRRSGARSPTTTAARSCWCRRQAAC